MDTGGVELSQITGGESCKPLNSGYKLSYLFRPSGSTVTYKQMSSDAVLDVVVHRIEGALVEPSGEVAD